MLHIQWVGAKLDDMGRNEILASPPSQCPTKPLAEYMPSASLVILTCHALRGLSIRRFASLQVCAILMHTKDHFCPKHEYARRCVVHVLYTIHSSHRFNGGSYELVLIHAFPWYVVVIRVLLPFGPLYEGRKHPNGSDRRRLNVLDNVSYNKWLHYPPNHFYKHKTKVWNEFSYLISLWQSLAHVYFIVGLHHCLHLFCHGCTQIHTHNRYCSISHPNQKVKTGDSSTKIYSLIEWWSILSKTKSFIASRLVLIWLSRKKSSSTFKVWG